MHQTWPPDPSGKPSCIRLPEPYHLPPTSAPPCRSVLADEVGRSLYEELDFRIEVRCAALRFSRAVLWTCLVASAA